MLQEVTIDFVFHFMLIFARLGAAFSTFPALGDKSIMMRARVMFAVLVTFVSYPIIAEHLPKYTENFGQIVSLIIIELLIGFIIAIGAKIYFLGLNVVGQILSMQSGLGAATFFDPIQRSQVAIFTTFLFIATTSAIFASDTHYLFIQGVIESYTRFPPGELLKVSDVSNFVTHIINDSFILAFKMSAPFLIVSIAILVGSGVLSRLMPNLQVFFVVTPAQILVMYCILYIIVISLINKILESIASTMNLVI